MQKVKLNDAWCYIYSEQEHESVQKALKDTTEKWVNRKEVAKMWGIRPSTLSEHPEYLPHFGQGSKGVRNALFLRSDIELLISIGKDRLSFLYHQKSGKTYEVKQ